MEYEKVKQWLDALIENMEQTQSLRDFNNQLKTCTESRRYIQLFKGIEIAADVMGLPLMEEEVAKTTTYANYPRYRYSFVYNNTTFSQIEKERLRHVKEGKTEELKELQKTIRRTETDV